MAHGTTQREFLARLDAVERRLAQHAHASEAAPGPHRLTEADPGTGEQWQWGQVWAHLAEFVPYWMAQASHVLTASGGVDHEPVPFGRVKSNPERIAAIERDRAVAVDQLWARLQGQIAALRAFLSEMTAREWAARGLHPTLGVMDMPHLLDEFLVGHLEQHAAQLGGLASG
ncbi:MAG TPA: hypothetical protein VGQ42_13055 [Candidatus Dormibacteraeota bacterium]|jgi:hypothetical protein|nr:hypothetical protein [Candidatus Dormibacteraeota bacterium]